MQQPEHDPEVQAESSPVKPARSRLPSFSRPVKVIIVLIVLFLVIEGLSIAAFSINTWLFPKPPDQRMIMDVYQGSEWAEDYFNEFRESYKAEYHPYTGFRRVPNYSGTYITLDNESLRKTVNECSGASAYKVFVFGGSTVWGTGARNKGTIPSSISTFLCSNGVDVEVVNFGESGFTNTQGMIRLQLELRKGNIPDIAVFYDGVNDVYSAYQNSAAGLPLNIENRKADFNSRSEINLENIPSQLSSVRILNKLLSVFGTQAQEEITQEEAERLGTKTVSVYIENKRIIESIGEEFDFKPMFFWQPTLYTKEVKSPDEAGKIMIDKSRMKVHLEATKNIAAQKGTTDLSETFNAYNRTIFIDEVHLSEEGNMIVAEQIGAEILEHLSAQA